MFLLVAAALGAGPGEIREVVTFHTFSCQNASSLSLEGTCFTGYFSHPSIDCREYDGNCSTGQRVISHIEYNVSEACLAYTWTWVCAYTNRRPCGDYWCDDIALCVNNTKCICPDEMIGNAERHSCECEGDKYFNGSTCVTLVEPVNRTVTSPTTIVAEEEDGISVELWIVFCFAACVLGLVFGLWYADKHSFTAVHPEEIRHEENPMYESAP